MNIYTSTSTQDPRSFNGGLSMRYVNVLANMWPCDLDKPTGDPAACAVDAELDGTVKVSHVYLCLYLWL